MVGFLGQGLGSLMFLVTFQVPLVLVLHTHRTLPCLLLPTSMNRPPRFQRGSPLFLPRALIHIILFTCRALRLFLCLIKSCLRKAFLTTSLLERKPGWTEEQSVPDSQEKGSGQRKRPKERFWAWKLLGGFIDQHRDQSASESIRRFVWASGMIDLLEWTSVISVFWGLDPWVGKETFIWHYWGSKCFTCIFSLILKITQWGKCYSHFRDEVKWGLVTYATLRGE